MKFNRISFKQFTEDEVDHFLNYDDLKKPKRATKFSAGYDIYSVASFILKPGETIKLPTGFNIQLDPNMFLMIVPRSGLGFKYRCRLENTAGIIDADYINSDNEGHIWIKMTNEGNKDMPVNVGEAICQGIILPYFITEDDDTKEERNGGFGSTTK